MITLQSTPEAIVMRKKIKIDFVDFWPDLVKEKNYFTDILEKYYDVEISPDPDYLFCSYFDNRHLAFRSCVKIYFIGENMVPDFNLYDYAMGFHNISFEDRYLRLPLYALYKEDYELVRNKHTFSDEYYLSKKGFCNCVISNPYPFADKKRERMYKALSGYKTVASGGRWMNNTGGPVKDKIAFEKDYRFTLAFENSSSPGYTTEKIFEAFAGDTIPIYWGNPGIAREFNPGSFINCHDYPNMSSVVERVREIDSNEELFLKMIKTPALKEGSQAAECMTDGYADSFLRNIFDQKKDHAIRRNMIYVGQKYQDRAVSSGRFQNAMDIINRPVHLIRKSLAQKKQE